MSSLKIIDSLIRAGRFGEAATELEGARKAKSISLLEEAVILRRLGRFDEGLLRMRPELFQDNELKKKISDSLRIEYANHLTFLGLTSEAAFHLKRVSEKTGYPYSFAEGVLASTRGDFESARIHFESASVSSKATDYERIVAKSNLLNAELGCFRYDEVVKLGDELSRLLDPTAHRNLYAWRASCVSQAHAYLKQPALFELEIKRCLDTFQIQHQMTPQNSFQLNQLRFYPIGKLHCKTLSKVDFTRELNRLSHFQKTAHAFGDWESFRDLSIQAAYFKKDEYSLTRAYFGSPSPFQKKRIQSWMNLLGHELPARALAITSADIAYGNPKDAGPQLTTVNLNTGTAGLDPEKLPTRMMSALLRDLYRPVRTHELHDLVWGDSQFFSPIHAPARVHQVLNRLKAVLKKEKIPLQIQSQKDRYHLEIAPTLQILRAREDRHPFLNRWDAMFRDSWVLSKTAARSLDLTARSVQLKLAEHAVAFETQREGTALYYRLKE